MWPCLTCKIVHIVGSYGVPVSVVAAGPGHHIPRPRVPFLFVLLYCFLVLMMMMKMIRTSIDSESLALGSSDFG